MCKYPHGEIQLNTSFTNVTFHMVSDSLQVVQHALHVFIQTAELLQCLVDKRWHHLRPQLLKRLLLPVCHEGGGEEVGAKGRSCCTSHLLSLKRVAGEISAHNAGW